MIISKDNEKKAAACVMLTRKASQIGCVPQKSDLTSEELVFIKAHLGPWPRALEAAGLKEKRNETKRKISRHIKKKREPKKNSQ